MADFIKMGLVIGLSEDFMVYMDWGRVFKGPFPSNRWKIRDETHCVHNIITHVEWGHGPGSNIVLASIG